jgi:CheY-like chemotaxis protein
MRGIPQPTILLAEDSPATAMLVERAFRKTELDFVLHVVSDGREAVSYLSGEGRYGDRRAHPLPSMLITNIKMPHISGFELLTWVRRNPEFQDLPVVVISSSDLETDSSFAYDLGANSYLIKPISTEALLEVLRELKLDGRWPQGGAIP